MFAPWLMPVIAARKSFSLAGSAYSVSKSPGPPPLTSFCGCSGPQRFAEVAPEGVEAMVGHFENAADIRRLGLVQEQVRLRRVRVPIAAAREKAERDERIEKITRRSRMQAETLAERIKRLRTTRELAEHAELDGAQERLRRPEREPGLQDFFRVWLSVH